MESIHLVPNLTLVSKKHPLINYKPDTLVGGVNPYYTSSFGDLPLQVDKKLMLLFLKCEKML